MKKVCGTLKCDDGGNGYITLTPEFKAEHALYRADVLKDVLHDLEVAYQEAKAGIFPTSTKQETE